MSTPRYVMPLGPTDADVPPEPFGCAESVSSQYRVAKSNS
jgi:hypothetical protein